MALSRREIITGLAGVPLLSAAARGQSTASGRDRPMNVILIMADDAGRELFDFTDGQYQPTPHLSALAATSANLRTCYATPLCSPSRASLLTGLYAFENGWADNPRDDALCRVLAPGLRTLGNIFQDAGYHTALAGKWHLSHQDIAPERVAEAGFDNALAWAWRYGRQDSSYSYYWEPDVLLNGGTVEIPQGTYRPDMFAGFMLRAMAEAAADGVPFFGYYPMVLTHGPYCPAPGEAPDFSSLMDETRFHDTALPCDEGNVNTAASFRSMVNYTDQLVGRVLQYLDYTGLRDNTLVVFTTDNGTKRDVTGRYHGSEVSGGKGTFTDLGINVPTIVSAPGVAAGPVNMPFDFVGIHNMLAEVAAGARGPAINAALNTSTHAMTGLGGSWAITDGTWKLVSLDGAGFADMRRRSSRRNIPFTMPHTRQALFHIASDPLEQRPITPTAALSGDTTRAAWQNLMGEARARLNARHHVPRSAHYPFGRNCDTDT